MTCPLVGSSGPVTISSSVLLPEPFGPMMPKTPPRSIAKLTPSSAQNSSWKRRRLTSRISFRRASGAGYTRYIFETLRTSIAARIGSNQISERFSDLVKPRIPEPERRHTGGPQHAQGKRARKRVLEKQRAVGLDDDIHRVLLKQPEPAFGQGARRITNGRDEKPDRQHESHDLPDVPQEHAERREEPAESRRQQQLRHQDQRKVQRGPVKAPAR